MGIVNIIEENHPRETMNSKITNFFISEMHCDVTFVLKNGKNLSTIKAHKFILSAASEVFETMFYGEVVKKNGVKQEDQVEIKDISVSIFQMLLDFIYGKKVEFSSSQTLVDFYGAAHRYICTDAMNFASKAMHDTLSFWNAIPYYETAVLYDLQDLKEKCMEVFSKETSNILKSAKFLLVSPDIVNLIFKLEKKILDSELDLVYALERYIAVNLKSDCEIKEKVQPALDAIDFLTLPSDEVIRTSLLSTEEKKYIVSEERTNELSKVKPSSSQYKKMIRSLNEVYIPNYCYRCAKTSLTYYNHAPWTCPTYGHWKKEILEIYTKYKNTFLMDYKFYDVKILYDLFNSVCRF